MRPRSPRRTTRPYEAAPPPGVPQRIDDDSPTASMGGALGLRPGDRIGRYVIRNKLGRGGMGVVFGAYDPELGRRVALKLVRHRDVAPVVEAHVDERLRREAQALARLSHPNVVSLYDVGACEFGDYLALALVPGIDLERWLSGDEPRDWREIVDVFVQAGRGLSAAHVAGLIHRDFKPTNVIVGPQGHVTVVDFGLARCAELLDTAPNRESGDAHLRDSDDDRQIQLLATRLTDVNVIVGTRGYMAPEQLLGLTVGPTADQFSFCVALYEALYAVRPYPGDNAVETASAYSRGEITKPDDTHGVPTRLHKVMLRGLSIEPDDRYGSMAVLLDAIERAIEPPTTARSRTAAWLGACALSASLGAAGYHAYDAATAVDPVTPPAPTCQPDATDIKSGPRARD